MYMFALLLFDKEGNLITEVDYVSKPDDYEVEVMKKKYNADHVAVDIVWM